MKKMTPPREGLEFLGTLSHYATPNILAIQLAKHATAKSRIGRYDEVVGAAVIELLAGGEVVSLWSELYAEQLCKMVAGFEFDAHREIFLPGDDDGDWGA